MFGTLTKHKKHGSSSFFKNLFVTAKETVNEIAAQTEIAIEETEIADKPYIDKGGYFIDETVTKAKETATPYIEKVETFVAETIEKVKVTATQLTDKTEKILEDTQVYETLL